MMEYVPFSKRALAAIIDICLINAAVMLFGDVLMWLLDAKVDQDRLQLTIQVLEHGGRVDPEFLFTLLKATGIITVLSVGLLIWTDAILPATKWMGSPGKKLLGLAITDMNGKRISYGRAFGRHAAKFVSAITLVGFFMPLWRENRQAMHDAMCGTLVVKRDSLEAV